MSSRLMRVKIGVMNRLSTASGACPTVPGRGAGGVYAVPEVPRSSRAGPALLQPLDCRGRGPRAPAPLPARPAMSDKEQKRAELRRAALEYHEFPTPGKVAIAATKQLINQRDLALAYSPGVAAACEEIVADPVNAFRYTSRGNLVPVITNGTAGPGAGG